MSEWWTYSLADFALFSPASYYRLFDLYNAAIWPAQPVAIGLGVLIPVLGGRHQAWPRLAAAFLALAWAWVAWGFHLRHYAAINWAAPWFAASFAVQAALLIWAGVLRGTLLLAPSPTPVARIGQGLFLFALLAYPFVGLLAGRSWRQTEVFGLCPDPTALATLGLVLMAGRGHWLLMPLPAAWCAIGGATLWMMKAPEAGLLPLLGLAGLLLYRWRKLCRSR